MTPHGAALSAARGGIRSPPGAPPSRYALATMDRTRIVDVTDAATFAFLPPCADPAFDHRTCDYWEEADRGSKAHRPAWLLAPAPPGGGAGLSAAFSHDGRAAFDPASASSQ